MRLNQVLCAGIMALVFCASANATTFLVDDFNSYSLGALTPQTPNWTAHSGAGSNQVQVIPDGAPVGPQPPLQGIGLVQGAGAREDINTDLDITMEAGDKFYAGFCVKVDLTGTAPIDSVYFAHFKDSGTAAFPMRTGVTVPDVSGDYTFGLFLTGSSIGAKYPGAFSFGTWHRVLTSYEFDTGISEMWIDPYCPNGPDGNTKISITNTADINVAVLEYAFRQAAGDSTQHVDNLVVADTWAEACNVCIPEPGTMALLVLGGMALLRRR